MNIDKIVESLNAEVDQSPRRADYLSAIELYEHAKDGSRRAVTRLQESFASTDIPELLKPVLQIEFLNKLADLPQTWTKLADTRLVDNFGDLKFGSFSLVNDSKRHDRDGGQDLAGGLSPVGEYDAYPELDWKFSDFAARLAKHGNRVRFSWETFVTLGNFSLFDEFTSELARLAWYTEEQEIAAQFVTRSGLNTDNWKAGNNNLLSGNPELSIEGLRAGKNHIGTQTIDGLPVVVPSFQLVVGPEMADVAQDVLSTTTYDVTTGTGGSTVDTKTETKSAAGVVGNIELVVNPFIRQIAGNSAPATGWWLIPAKSARLRPSLAQLKLRGHETPLLSIKASDHRYTAGGEVPEFLGDFESDAIEQRIRHVVTGAFLTPYGTVYSNGTGS